MKNEEDNESKLEKKSNDVKESLELTPIEIGFIFGILVSYESEYMHEDVYKGVMRKFKKVANSYYKRECD